MPSLFQLHVQQWKDCHRCELGSRRNRTVFARGKVPCDVLFIGEAPGESEDSVGQPFMGPAGNLLQEKIIDFTVGRTEYRYALTNLLLCIPLDEHMKKEKTPPHESVEACKPRLIEFIELAHPRLIVAVGKEAEDYLTPGYQHSVKLSYRPKIISIIHPAAIIRRNITLQLMDIQKARVTISEALEELENYQPEPEKPVRTVVEPTDIPF